MKRKAPLALALAGAAALVLSATAASAQQGFYYGPAPSPDEEVIVTAPPYTNPGVPEYPGARVRTFTLSRAVHANDLDLLTWRGRHELRNRVRVEARLLCNQLDRMQPLTVQNSPPCYRNAVVNADYQVDAAIRHAYRMAER